MDVKRCTLNVRCFEKVTDHLSPFNTQPFNHDSRLSVRSTPWIKSLFLYCRDYAGRGVDDDVAARPNYRGWRICFIVLGVTGLAWLLFRDAAGSIGGGASGCLLFFPSLACAGWLTWPRNIVSDRPGTGDHLQFVHPSAPSAHQVQVLRRLEAGGSTAFSAEPDSQSSQDRQPPCASPRFWFSSCSTWLPSESNSCSADRTIFAYIGSALWSRFGLVLGRSWRLVTALFLHAGPVVVFNLFALYVSACRSNDRSARFAFASATSWPESGRPAES